MKSKTTRKTMVRTLVLHSQVMKRFRTAIFFAAVASISSCATYQHNAGNSWAAHGYLTPGSASEPELIGVYDTHEKCETAADEWASRQVVGNPVHAECYPVDRD